MRNYMGKNLKCDGIEWNVLSFRARYRTNEGTLWHFITDSGRTIVVTPYQTERVPAAAPGSCPDTIISVFDADTDFADVVRYGVSFNARQLELRQSASDAAETDFREWRAKQTFSYLDKWEQTEAAKSPGTAGSIDTCATPEVSTLLGARLRHKLDSPSGLKQVEKERNEVAAKREEFLTKRRRSVEGVIGQERRVKLDKLNKALTDLGAPGVSDRTTKNLFKFIAEKVGGGNAPNVQLRHTDYQTILEKVKELAGKDISNALALMHHVEIPHLVWRLATRGMDNGISQHDAECRVLQAINYVAVFKKNATLRFELIKDFSIEDHDPEDRQRLIGDSSRPSKAKLARVSSHEAPTSNRGSDRPKWIRDKCPNPGGWPISADVKNDEIAEEYYADTHKLIVKVRAIQKAHSLENEPRDGAKMKSILDNLRSYGMVFRYNGKTAPRNTGYRLTPMLAKNLGIDYASEVSKGIVPNTINHQGTSGMDCGQSR